MRNVLFDLDGTLTDPRKGILRSLSYAMERMGSPSPVDFDAGSVIGPPLQDSLARLLGSDDPSLIERALLLYRERYGTVGLFENRLYEGIHGMLHTLTARNLTLLIVTSKPTVYASRIADHFGISQIFSAVYGSEPVGPNTEKAELIGRALAGEDLNPAETLMVGDRRHDIEGARAWGIGAIAVSWGFGSREELLSARPEFIADHPREIPPCISRT
jgi:phosphoglycolate phosphatase